MPTQVSQERLARPFLKTPDEITPAINKLCQRIAPTQTPAYIQHQPDPGAILQECYANVSKAATITGGETVFGWAIWEWPHAFVEAEHHAVLQTESGLVDVTPHAIPIDRVLFLPDPSAPYEPDALRRRPNVREVTRDAPAVHAFLQAADQSVDWIEQFPAGVPVMISPRQQAERAHLEHEMRDRQIELILYIASRTGRNDRCICGSERKFKHCCGPHFR